VNCVVALEEKKNVRNSRPKMEETCQSISSQPVAGREILVGRRLVTAKVSLLAGYYFQQSTQNIPDVQSLPD